MLNIELTAIGADDDFFSEGGSNRHYAARWSRTRRGVIDDGTRCIQYPKLSKLALLCSPIENGSLQGNSQNPFVVLDCENIDAFIRNEIEPKTKLKRSDIA